MTRAPLHLLSITVAALAALTTWSAPAPAAADELDDARFLTQCVETNLKSGTARAESICLGLIALPCTDAGPSGDDALAQEKHETACLKREHAAWQVAMDEWWPDLLAAAVTLDARDDRQSASADALRQAQRSWESFAEAECGYAAALWGRSTYRDVSRADCEMRTLARRAIQLRAQTGLDS
ncbi:DUF1311 domain-containing protein [Albimonas sp. CAU 1670]|uniref:lysozyme inhibitor LprI family protein n=1 Tax=Albimonas sp. CAU 1670 TaxID=3032599 RepID=UPI0023D9CA40|nr:lysozyme inhibitor LprI family protein [Albimonas sp. CAU 1670]MDF2231135.1 DUF1311 domain-containing protein [Albimonas sp. CAU 1670]